ncbi:MAG: CcmD family protein [Bacteroidota bacterium]
MKRITTLFTFITFVLTTFNTSAQAEVEMADTMRASGKIYVVVAILVLILVGLFVYVFLMDRKISKLEEKVNERA